MATIDTQSDPRSSPRHRPELLAPAGDRACLVAAIENGADAVYFGLRGHNARARAANFGLEELPEVMALLHQRGVRGYVTLNTLAFPGELEGLEGIVRRVTAAGVDAAIVQDIGLARLIRAVTPDLEIHASTQMSITSASGVRMAEDLGCSRVILARELSVREIARIREQASLPVEVFVHGALCVAYSGQCLTSEALGGRSANRGECAQACRMEYEVIQDGERVDLGDISYLLSPQDLAAFDLVPKLVELGVSSLKIEGRLKSPDYVATITRNYRKAIDAAAEARPDPIGDRDIYEMEMTFSRGFSHGFLDGNNHKVLVRGDYAKKRGVLVGEVASVVGNRVLVELSSPVKPGDGVVFDADPGRGAPEQGGRVYEVDRPAKGTGRPDRPGWAEDFIDGPASIGFGRRDLDLDRIVPGQRLWKTDDPELSRSLKRSHEGGPRRTVRLDLRVRAVAGEPLAIEASTATGIHARVDSGRPLEVARTRPADAVAIRGQLDRMGGTNYRLGDLEATIDGSPMVPLGLLNELRRALVARLDEIASLAPVRAIAEAPVLPGLREAIRSRAEAEGPPGQSEPAWSALCRTVEQVEAARGSGIGTIYLDFQDIKRYGEAVSIARRGPGDPAVFIASTRIEKPGEENLFRYLSKQGADGLLVRNAGGIAFCSSQRIPFVADFSLNAANDLSVEWLKASGATRVTASYDLSADQLFDLLRASPPSWLEVVVHQQIPMFHMEHCVFCAFLSPGTDKTNCGRPCDRHEVKLRDRVGMEHPLTADVGCRNTLYNAVPQTAAEFLPALVRKGLRHLRLEFLDDSPESVARIIGLYTDALSGRRDARTLWKRLKATNHYGVTRGQLAVL
ncbi:U32 family peptidase [Tautonia plasticadhaerens]|uniref:Putative protease YhbU n=1 Tax=Tautonia plasticadhaerens TaxID=2527974 RepID=A0A518H7E0_9BACT|nr:U32 family peptidase [Tautonia plasticadhaerens]QDV36787.1 putative protease YhbU precursor [Tautonia plasticadhaerens]